MNLISKVGDLKIYDQLELPSNTSCTRTKWSQPEGQRVFLVQVLLRYTHSAEYKYINCTLNVFGSESKFVKMCVLSVNIIAFAAF